MNEQVDKEYFDNSNFVLKFPSVDDMVDKICTQGDNVTISKIDIERAFKNLCMDPADTLKLDIIWKDDFFIDVAIAFRWVHAATPSCS